ncbi:hypothetical protein GJT88_02000 [Enterobacteriaceae endosymbiont of Donacia tomentosa]|uniref:S4 domain-containing protein n=1 Tax=Enterobacteriaceae endosymbiont of Donacia tomentosa TaxID=2675787 RepID=UPI001449DE6C|nr:S4 domain-containing protein [Enterobacteriaceae endosymbiont of Donacia tomentosa]QJC31809.1 hypothetical protein GJT88_02000 [Enterobacteriaceae endosymbiont of Donacia tomentosa]
MKKIKLVLKVCNFFNKIRLDIFLSKKLPQISRSQFKNYIINKNIKINNKIVNIPQKKYF